MTYPSRHSTRLAGFNYARDGAYSITVCTHKRQHLFGDVVDADVQLTPIGQIVAATWYEIPTHFPNVTLDAFIVMPNHIHGIIALRRPTIVLVGAQFIAPTVHVGTTDQLNNMGRTGATSGETADTVHEMGAMNCAPTATTTLGRIVRAFKARVTAAANHALGDVRTRVWQRNYHDHIIRNAAELIRIRQYIADNPRNWQRDPERREKWAQ